MIFFVYRVHHRNQITFIRDTSRLQNLNGMILVGKDYKQHKLKDHKTTSCTLVLEDLIVTHDDLLRIFGDCIGNVVIVAMRGGTIERILDIAREGIKYCETLKLNPTACLVHIGTNNILKGLLPTNWGGFDKLGRLYATLNSA